MMSTAQVPVYSNGIEKELVTPTGCAIATTLATAFGPPPHFTLQKVGLGAGGIDLPIPNILRLWIGTVAGSITFHRGHQHGHSTTPTSTTQPAPPLRDEDSLSVKTQAQTPEQETIVKLQTQIDDSSPQVIGHVFEQLLAAGAVDVFSQAIAMKKNRLGTLLTVLCPLAAAERCKILLFKETTTLGIRSTTQTRTVLAREIVPVKTAYGLVPVKVARLSPKGSIWNMQPEYEDCAALARSHGVPLTEVQQAALIAATAQLKSDVVS